MKQRLISTMIAVSALVAVGHGSASARSAPPPEPGPCQVHTLAVPDGAVHGRVMDIEWVRGRGVVYYGAYSVRAADGSLRQHPVVWYGLNGQPVPVGPPDAEHGAAFELTARGVVNGETVDLASGQLQAWVQNLLTRRLTLLEELPTGAPVEVGIAPRRLNDRNAATGTAFWPDANLPEGGMSAAVWKRYDREPSLLPLDGGAWSEGWDINNRGDVVGSIFYPVPGEEGGFAPRPTLWDKRGEPMPMAGPPAGAYPQLLNDARQAAGTLTVVGTVAVHGEAAFWPSPDRVVPLGLLPGGGASQAYGMDEMGWVVGYVDVFDPRSPGAGEFGAIQYSALWIDGDGSHVRVLPSPYAADNGLTDWTSWWGGAAHAVNGQLNQVGTYAHSGFLPDGSLEYAPTVFVNADRCGQVLETTHLPFWEPGAPSRPAGEPASDPSAAQTPPR